MQKFKNMLLAGAIALSAQSSFATVPSREIHTGIKDPIARLAFSHCRDHIRVNGLDGVPAVINIASGRRIVDKDFFTMWSPGMQTKDCVIDDYRYRLALEITESRDGIIVHDVISERQMFNFQQDPSMPAVRILCATFLPTVEATDRMVLFRVVAIAQGGVLFIWDADANQIMSPN